MISEQLLHAPDLVAKSEFEKTKTGKRLVATTYSSRALGLTIREEVPVTELKDGPEVSGQRTANVGSADGARPSTKEMRPRRAEREDQ